MGIFDFLKKKKPESAAAIADVHEDGISSSLQQLLERYGGIAMEKQLSVGETIGSLDWNVDMTAGTATFGSDLTFPIQMLGSVSHQSQTWLWAWANDKAQMSAHILNQANQLKAHGIRHDIPELKEGMISAANNEGHIIASIASGMFNNRFYYAGNYGAGTAFFTIDEKEEDLSAHSETVLTVFPQLIMSFDLNHRAALGYYLKDKGFQVVETKDELAGVSAAFTVKARFDDRNRLINLDGGAS